jgi:hypothetical protein
LGGEEAAWNILPGTQEAEGTICAEHEIPELAPGGFLVEVREDEVRAREAGKGTGLGQQERDGVGGVQDEMDSGVGEGGQKLGELREGAGIVEVGAREIDEADDGRGAAAVPASLDGDVEDLAVEADEFGGVGGAGVEAPDAGGLAFDEDRLGEPLAEDSGLARARGTNEDMERRGGRRVGGGRSAPELAESGAGQGEFVGQGRGRCGMGFVEALDGVQDALGVERGEAEAVEDTGDAPGAGGVEVERIDGRCGGGEVSDGEIGEEGGGVGLGVALDGGVGGGAGLGEEVGGGSVWGCRLEAGTTTRVGISGREVCATTRVKTSRGDACTTTRVGTSGREACATGRGSGNGGMGGVLGQTSEDFDLRFDPEFGQAAGAHTTNVEEDGLGAEGGADLGDGGGDIGGGEGDTVGLGLGRGGGRAHGLATPGKG